MGGLVNLRRARKGRERRLKEAEAVENRVRFGMTKAERQTAKSEREKAERGLDALRLTHENDA